MTYNTEKRAELVRFLESNGGSSVTIEEICAAILTDGKGKSTVYRLMSKLVSDGGVRKISDPKTRHVTYQYIHAGHCSEHMHLKCKECGKLIHLDEETSRNFERQIKCSRGCALDEGALLFGVCGSCVQEVGK